MQVLLIIFIAFKPMKIEAATELDILNAVDTLDNLIFHE